MKRFLALLMALVMVFALCACSNGDNKDPKATQTGNEATSWDQIEPIKIVYAHANALSETNNKMVDNWMAAVEKASEGKISFDYHPGGSLGTYVEIIEQVESGAVNMSISDMSLFESYCPAFGVLYSPFIIDDYDHAKNIAYGKAGELLKADLAKDTNTYLLGMIMNGKRVVDTTVPIKSLDDCKGVIIRTPEAQVYTDTFKMLGMSPTAMSLTDTYTGIQTGTVQGFECPAQAIYNGGYHKIAPYIWKSGHMYSFQGWTANQTFWDSLPELARTTMIQCWEDLQDDYNDMLIAEEDEIYAKMEAEGCTISEVDRQSLIDLCSDYWQTKADSIGTEGTELLNAINDCRGK